MAAGDYKIMRNNANTDALPDNGTELLLLWDTAVSNVGSGITYASGTFTLGETGRFLVMCSDYVSTTDIINNTRTNARTKFTLGGTVLQEGTDAGYIRKSGGSQGFINQSMAIIEVTTTVGNGDELKINHQRIDGYTSGTINRVANNRSGVTIIKLDDTADYGRYESSSPTTTSGTDNTAVVINLQTEIEEDVTFTRTTNTISIATNDLVLCVYSMINVAAPGARAEFQGRLTLGGTVVPGSYTQTYIRDYALDTWGGMSGMCLINPTSGQNLELEVVTRELGGTVNFNASLQLMKLPLGAEAAIMEATSGDYNTATTNFTHDTLPYIDTAAFTATAGNANIDVDNSGDYLVMVGLGHLSGVASTRAVPAVQFRVNTTDIEYAGHSSYHRNSGTAEYTSLNSATLLTGLSVNDSLYVHNDRIGTTTTAIAADSGQFAVIRLSSLFSGTPASYDQTSFRIRNDNGNETAATWKAAVNTDVTDQTTDENIRLRFLLQEGNDVEDINVEFQLQYNQNGGGWNDVNGLSNVIRSSASPNVADAAHTTQQVGAGTFIGSQNGFDEVNGLAGGANLDWSVTVNQETEVEFCFQIRSADTNPADTIQFRVVKEADEIFDTYTNTPTITVGTPAYTQASFRLRNDNGDETTATWKQNLNTNGQIKEDENFRVRFLIQETTNIVAVDTSFQLQYNLSSGGWNNVTGVSSVVRASASPNIADGTNTTQQLGAATFITPNAGFDEVDGIAGGVSLDFDTTINQEVEVEFSVQIRSVDTIPGQTLQLRIIEGGNVITYTNTPTITIPDPSYDQTSFRGREDDGNETTATWITTVNSNFSYTQDTNLRMRFLVQEINDDIDSDIQFQLQYNHNSGGWNDVNGLSNVIRSSSSPNFTDGIDTTQQIGVGTLVTPNSGMDEVNGLVGGSSLDFSTTTNEEVELEFCFQIRSIDTSVTDTIELRLVKESDQIFNTYTNTPTITVILIPIALYTQTSFRGRNDDGNEATATWIDIANSNFFQKQDENFRIRFLITESEDLAEADVAFQLQYNLNVAGWINVSNSSSVIRSASSVNITDGGDTTQQLGIGTFVTPNGGLDEVDGLVGGNNLDFTITINQEVEVEFCIQIRSIDTNRSDSLQLRIIKDGSVLDSYTNTPTITIPTGAGMQLASAEIVQISSGIENAGVFNFERSLPWGAISIALRVAGSATNANLSIGDKFNTIETPLVTITNGAKINGTTVNGDVTIDGVINLTDVLIKGDLVLNNSATYSFSNVTVGGDTTNSDSIGFVRIIASDGSVLTTSEPGTGNSEVDILIVSEITITNLVDNTIIEILEAGTNTSIDGVDNATDGTIDDRYWSFTHTVGSNIDIVVHNINYRYIKILNYTVPANDISIKINQRFDRSYSNPL